MKCGRLLKVGNYYVKGNKIYLDSNKKSKADIIYYGVSRVSYSDAFGATINKVVTKIEAKEFGLMIGEGNSNAEKNEKIIKELKILQKK